MATFRLVFRVSKVQQYSDNFVQDLLRVGLSSAMPLEVPELGEINTIILLGSKAILSSVDCLWPYEWMCVVGETQIGHSCAIVSLPQSSRDLIFFCLLIPKEPVGSHFMLLEMR